MEFIPKDAIWYIAQVVLEITVEGESRNVVHINYLLVRAESPDAAYDEALRLGSEHKSSYANKDGKRVQIDFRGLRNLSVVYEPLEHGTELLYEERTGVPKADLDGLILPKQSLAVFKPISKSVGPDYSSDEIQREARSLMERTTSD